MGEVLRLFGLMEDGALIPYIVGGVVVWATMTARGLRPDLDAMRAENREAHDGITKNVQAVDAKVDRLGERLGTVAADVSFMAGRQHTESSKLSVPTGALGGPPASRSSP